MVFRATEKCCNDTTFLLDRAQHLSAIHASPPSVWPLLVEALVDEGWTVKDTEREVKRIRELLEARPDWYECEDLTLANLARATPAHAETCSRRPNNTRPGAQICTFGRWPISPLYPREGTSQFRALA